MNIIVKMHDRARVIETTRMDLHSGIMLEDDFLDISGLPEPRRASRAQRLHHHE